MRRIGGAIQCALKVSGMNRAGRAMSGYAALTRPTGLSLGRPIRTLADNGESGSNVPVTGR